MSFRLIDVLFEIDLTPVEKAVLAALLRHVSNDGGDCWASVETLAYESGASVRTVQRTLRELETKVGHYPEPREDGSSHSVPLLKAVSRSVGGQRRTTHYRFLNPQACADILRAVDVANAKRKNPVSLTPLVQPLHEPRQPDTVEAEQNPVSLSQNGDNVTRNGVTVSQNGVTVSPESVLNPSVESVHQPTPTARAVAEAFQNKTGQVLEVPKSREADLLKAVAGYSLEEIERAFTLANDQFDGFKQGRARFNKLLDVVGGYLQTARQQMEARKADEDFATFTPEEDAEYLAQHKKRWGLDLPTLETELQNEEATLAMFRLEPEEVERTKKHIESLREQIEEEKACLLKNKSSA